MQPLISIIIPCRNEEKYIGKCLDSIIANDYPKDKLEVLVIDGMSEDKTKEILEKYSSQYFFIKRLENQGKFTPFGLNIGVKESKGEIILRMDAHAIYEKDYISKCVRYLNEYSVDNIGGRIMTIPRENTILAQAIALCLSNQFGAGNSYFRIGSKEPILVDTVFGGCYKKEVFGKIGLFNEKLKRSQDLEFNLRLRRAGGKILLIPEIVSYYFSASNFKDFLKHNFLDGIWATYPLKLVKVPFRLRHYFPLFFVSSLIGLALLSILSPVFLPFLLSIFGLYLLINLYFSLGIAIREKDFKYFFIIPIVFAARHFGYGLGSILGLIKP